MGFLDKAWKTTKKAGKGGLKLGKKGAKWGVKTTGKGYRHTKKAFKGKGKAKGRHKTYNRFGGQPMTKADAKAQAEYQRAILGKNVKAYQKSDGTWTVREGW